MKAIPVYVVRTSRGVLSNDVMLSYSLHRAGLRSVFAALFRETDFTTEFET